MVWWGNISLQSFGNLFSGGEVKSGFFAFPITVLAVVTVINAVNMTDGTDGLAGSIAFVEFFYLAWLSHLAHHIISSQLFFQLILHI